MHSSTRSSVVRTPRVRVPASSSAPPDGWFSIDPQSRSNGSSRESRGRSGPDALGLANTVDPLTFLVKKPQHQHSRGSDERSNSSNMQQNPRRRRLRAAGESAVLAAQGFFPQRSPQLARLPLLKEKRTTQPVIAQSNQSVVVRTGQLNATTEMPLHELIGTVDDAVEADPTAELNQSAIARLFMDQWLRQFEADRRSYKSVAVRYEVGFKELQQQTVNLPRPNDLITTFCTRVLEDLTPHFGLYAPLFRVISAELLLSIYARDGFPYFALVKHHKRLLLTLRKDKEWREERNDVLAGDIENVYSMFRHFLAECTFALSRMLLHEWYSVAVVQKKNSRKYVAYFSNWFSSAPKAILRKLFVAWKHEAAVHRIEKIQKQMQIDLQGLHVVKRQVDELTRQRDIAQTENLAMRNDRKHAEEWTRQLELRIKAASTYLDTTRRREALVCQEGHLRVEAVACLPPLILESLLRGYHAVGFLQQAPVEETPAKSVPLTGETSVSTVPKDQAEGSSSLLQECLDEIARLRSIVVRRNSSTSSPVHGGRSNSVTVSVAPEEMTAQPSPVQAAAAASGNTGRRAAAGAVSQGEMSGRTFSKFFLSLRKRIQVPGAKVLFTPPPMVELSVEKESLQSQHETAQLAREYDRLLRAIRVQDEHYASHSKLFSSRMLESHEVSLVPNSYLPNRDLQVSDGSAGTDKGDLGVINGVKRFWVSNLAARKPRTPSHVVQILRARTRRQSVFGLKDRPPPTTPLLENLELFQETDFDISPLHSRGFTILLLAHVATEYGSLLFSPADMSSFTHNAYLHPAGDKQKASEDPKVSPQDKKTRAAADVKTRSITVSPSEQNDSLIIDPIMSTLHPDSSSLRTIQPIVSAYGTWNQISEQLITAGVVQSRGFIPGTVVNGPGDAGDPLKNLALSGTPIRPILRHQFEPLSHSSLLVPARDKSGRRSSITTGDGNTYHTARIRHLTAEEPANLIQNIESIHKSVKATSVNLQAFHVTHRQLCDLRVTQWEQSSELASQFVNTPKEVSPPNAVGLVDHRQHVYEYISLTNSTMRRIFSVEESPEVELTNVRTVFEKHQRLIRQLYTPYRPNIKHAMTLDDLWHVVKILRLPREIHVLPILRDEELVANGYEQLFSPEDLAELFLQLCNEQFQPQILPLSARVEYLVTHHMPIALQNQSLIRVLMHRSDVKHAIGSHSQTIRIIFRRYCAKEHELIAPAVGAAKPRPRHTGHGISKYMHMIDWQAFIQDYHLVRARFSSEQAMSVFRNVQEATTGSDDQLELIYSEFCEALVGVAMFYFPDPFLMTATKVTQFFRRYLPLSPDEAHDHA